MKGIADLKVQMTKYDRKQSDMEKQLLKCQAQKELLISKLSKLDMYIRRENLKISGIPEDSMRKLSQHTKKYAKCLLKSLELLKVKIFNFNAVIGLVGALILVKTEMLSLDS